MQHDRTESTPSRRVNVKDHRGVYYREDKNGKRRYEIGFRDSAGSQHGSGTPATSRTPRRRSRRSGAGCAW